MALCVGTLVAVPAASASPTRPRCAVLQRRVFPAEPYVNNCAIPHRPPPVLGSAPDATVLLNCSIGSDVFGRSACRSTSTAGMAGTPGRPGTRIPPVTRSRWIGSCGSCQRDGNTGEARRRAQLRKPANTLSCSAHAGTVPMLVSMRRALAKLGSTRQPTAPGDEPVTTGQPPQSG